MYSPKYEPKYYSYMENNTSVNSATNFFDYKTEIGKHSLKKSNKKPNLKQEVTINLVSKIISSKSAKKVIVILILTGFIFSIIGVISTINFIIN